MRCFVCGDQPCPVWGGAVSAAFVRRCWRGYRATGPIGRRCLPVLERLGWSEPPGTLFRRLFEAFPERSVLVDSSKSVGWTEWNARDPSYRTVVILLQRDLRALSESMMRTLGMTIEDATRATLERLAVYRAHFDTYAPAQKFSLRYEDLAQRPQETASRLCAWLGLPYEPGMLDYSATAHHTFGGNPGPNATVRVRHAPVRPLEGGLAASPEIRLDERWRAALGAELLERFEAIGGSANRQLGYHD
jgi:hypothetical protein